MRHARAVHDRVVRQCGVPRPRLPRVRVHLFVSKFPTKAVFSTFLFSIVFKHCQLMANSSKVSKQTFFVNMAIVNLGFCLTGTAVIMVKAQTVVKGYENRRFEGHMFITPWRRLAPKCGRRRHCPSPRPPGGPSRRHPAFLVFLFEILIEIQFRKFLFNLLRARRRPRSSAGSGPAAAADQQLELTKPTASGKNRN